MTDRLPLTDAELQELENLDQAATPGPWTWEDWSAPEYPFGPYTLVAPPHTRADSGHSHDPDLGNAILTDEDRDVGEGDRNFIAAARTALPRLLAEVKARRKDTSLSSPSSGIPEWARKEADHVREGIRRYGDAGYGGARERALVAFADRNAELERNVVDLSRQLQAQIDDKHRILREYEARVTALQRAYPTTSQDRQDAARYRDHCDALLDKAIGAALSSPSAGEPRHG